MAAQDRTGNFFEQPTLGNIIAIISGLSFYFLCMILPLVGPTGSKVGHAAKNAMAFSGVLALTSLLAGMAVFLKIKRRAIVGGPLPVWSIGLCVVCLFLWIVFLTGGFKI